MELTEHDVPLVIVEVMDKNTSIVIGELSATDKKSIDEVMKTGLGFGLSHSKPKPKPTSKSTLSTSAGSNQDLPHVEKELQEPTLKVKPEKETKPQPPNPSKVVVSKVVVKDVKIKVAKVSMELDQILHIPEKSLATYPMSKYRPPNYCPWN